MKNGISIAVLSIMVFVLSAVLNADPGSIEQRGQTLFNDTKLSGSQTDKSCNSCHPEGDNLKKLPGKNGDQGNWRRLLTRVLQRRSRGRNLMPDRMT